MCSNCELQGANRKMLHENRRDEKRRMQGGGEPTSRLHTLTLPYLLFLLSLFYGSIFLHVFMSTYQLPKSWSVDLGNLSGRKKSDGEFHEGCDRSEFYHMKELDKPAALFNAPDDYDRTYLDPQTLGYDLSDMEPMVKRPRPSERRKTSTIVEIARLSSELPNYQTIFRFKCFQWCCMCGSVTSRSTCLCT